MTIQLLEKEREAIAAQEMETALQIEKAESQLREEEQRRADLRERVLGNPHQVTTHMTTRNLKSL